MIVKEVTGGNVVKAEVTVRDSKAIDTISVVPPSLLGQTRPMSSSNMVPTTPLMFSSLTSVIQPMAEDSNSYVASGKELGVAKWSAKVYNVFQGCLGAVEVSS